MMLAFEYLSKPMMMKNGINYMVIENTLLFRNVLTELMHENGERFVISENYVPMDFKKSVFVIKNLLDFEYTDKKLMNKINAELEATANSSYYQELFEIRSSLFSLGEKLTFEYDFDYSITDEIDTSSIIKLLSFHPRDDSGNMLEKLILYLKLLKKYMNVRLFICCHLTLYFQDTEIHELTGALTAMDISLVDFENTDQYIAERKNIVLIDKDLCEVIDNE